MKHPGPRVRTDFPHQVTVRETVWIPLADGTRLAARLWLPDGAEANPVPAILEYVPYRRRDGTRLRDEPMHAWFAGHGYASIRVDLRGSGDSDGLLLDEYLKQEQDDAVEVIAWLAAQPWCSGRVGMIGISWGGFNGLQVAARRPPALKAIVTSCSTDDRYNDDIHYMGGCVLGDNFSWASTFFGRVSPPPPDPEVVGERWREMWLERLEATPLLLETWLSHQRRDAYWKHGSVREDYAAIGCPVFAIGGWNDGYQNAIPRLLAGLQVPRIGVVGAWSHTFGFRGGPGPLVGVIQEFLRWWDHWLKDEDTGIMEEPMLRAYMMESERPAAWVGDWPGRWVAEPVWPVVDGGIAMKNLALNDRGALADEAERGNRPMSLRSPLSVGFAAGEWCRHDTGTDLATDQRMEDAGSLCFDGEPLAERLEFLGAPEVTLEFSVDRPVAQAVVRLNDIHPDGAVTRITWGVKNLTHLHDQENPVALEPGKRYRVTFKLNDTCYSVLPGHRLRVAVSTSYFPMVWPAPEPVTLTLMPGTSSVALPVRRPRPELDGAVRFEPAEAAPQGPATTLEPGSMTQRAIFDARSGTWQMEVVANEGRSRIEEIDLETGAWRRELWSIHPDDPTTASGEIAYDFEKRRGDWTIRHEGRCTMKLTKDAYVIHADLDAFENGERIFARSVTRTVPRDHT